jgi:hypothetical protein
MGNKVNSRGMNAVLAEKLDQELRGKSAGEVIRGVLELGLGRAVVTTYWLVPPPTCQRVHACALKPERTSHARLPTTLFSR